MKSFEHCQPKSLKEAVSILSRKGKNACVIAGGTDLINAIRNREICPELVVDLKNIKGLDFIEHKSKTGLRIGALAKIRDIETSKIVKKKFPLLSEAAHTLGSVQVRNIATAGGNLCNAAPSADMAPALIALGARVKVQGSSGKRIIPLENFFVGPGKTALKKGEILTEIIVPDIPKNSKVVYIKHGLRKAMDIAIAGVCILVSKGNGKLKDARIVLGAVAPTPIRAKSAEKILLDGELNEELITKTAEEASRECKPINDVRGSEWYRMEVVRVLVARGIRMCIQ